MASDHSAPAFCLNSSSTNNQPCAEQKLQIEIKPAEKVSCYIVSMKLHVECGRFKNRHAGCCWINRYDWVCQFASTGSIEQRGSLVLFLFFCHMTQNNVNTENSCT